jgi:hypothetical protein
VGLVGRRPPFDRPVCVMRDAVAQQRCGPRLDEPEIDGDLC